MLAPVHLKFNTASAIASPLAAKTLTAFLSSDPAAALLNSSSSGPGTRASLVRLLKGLNDEHAQLAATAAASADTALAPAPAVAGAKADKKSSLKEKKRKNKDAPAGETKRRKV